MLNKKTVGDLSVNGKRILLRVDFNVPINEKGKIIDNKRIQEALPTIKYLKENGAKIIIISHLGRPKGKFNLEYSLKPVAEELSEILSEQIIFSNDIIGSDVFTKSSRLKEGQIMLLENIRFHAEEEKNDPNFAKKLSELGDIYVNDAFGTAHRAHASTAGIAKYLPSAIGFLVKKEIEIMGKALSDPQRPFTAILGGAKISDKILVVGNLIDKVDNLLIGGGMAYTFLKARGKEIGESIIDKERIDLAAEILKKAEEKGVKLILPIDIVVANEFKADAHYKNVDIDSIPEDYMGLDIGEKTRKIFSEIVENSKTVIWNGPMGVFEMPAFSKGTSKVAEAMSRVKGITIIGGGDSAAAVEQLGFAEKISHISTGGGASLKFLEGKTLEGLAAIDDK